jgi:signal transduction histidine kinase
VGILRYAKEFSLLYEQSGRILNAVFYIALAIFAAAFLFSYLLSRHITIPLVKLARASTEVMNGNLDVRIALRQRDEIGRLAGNFNDMIERIKHQIGRIERDRDRLEKLNSERKQFFDNVTHELKTPLTSILGYAEMIRENGEKDEAFFRKGMTHIVEESQRLHGLVLHLLELSQESSGSGEYDRIDVGQVLRDVCDSMNFKAKRYNKDIRCETGEGLYVLAQSDKLRQVFINLIDNAIKYGYANSEIAVTAERATDSVLISVVNDGDTIAPDHLTRIFEPFYQSDREKKEAGSMGLGLSIAKAIIDDSGGSIRIVSDNGQTSVYAELPYMKPERLPI